MENLLEKYCNPSKKFSAGIYSRREVVRKDKGTELWRHMDISIPLMFMVDKRRVTVWVCETVYCIIYLCFCCKVTFALLCMCYGSPRKRGKWEWAGKIYVIKEFQISSNLIKNLDLQTQENYKTQWKINTKKDTSWLIRVGLLKTKNKNNLKAARGGRGET